MAGMVNTAGETVNPAATPAMLIRSAGSPAESVLILIVKVPVPVDEPAGMVIEVSRLVIR